MPPCCVIGMVTKRCPKRKENENMKMDKVANSGNDEFYTPAYAIEPILKYIKPNSNIWCPFDTEDSLFVKIFKQNGHKVYCTHKDNGKDFFDLVPPSILSLYNF